MNEPRITKAQIRQRLAARGGTGRSVSCWRHTSRFLGAGSCRVLRRHCRRALTSGPWSGSASRESECVAIKGERV